VEFTITSFLDVFLLTGRTLFSFVFLLVAREDDSDFGFLDGRNTDNKRPGEASRADDDVDKGRFSWRDNNDDPRE